jgi:hypothetical protein
MRKIGSYENDKKQTGFIKKNGELSLTPRTDYSLISLAVQDFQSSALPTELPAHIQIFQ